MIDLLGLWVESSLVWPGFVCFGLLWFCGMGGVYVVVCFGVWGFGVCTFYSCVWVLWIWLVFWVLSVCALNLSVLRWLVVFLLVAA